MTQRVRFFLIGGAITAVILFVLWLMFAISRSIWHHPWFLIPILIVVLGGGLASYIFSNDEE